MSVVVHVMSEPSGGGGGGNTASRRAPGPSPRLGGRPQLRHLSPRLPLPASLILQRNIAFAAVRWVVAALVVVGVTIWVLLATPSTVYATNDCALAMSKTTSMLSVWVAVSTFRVAAGALLRVGMWWLFDVLRAPELQSQSLYGLIRSEFILMLLSVMWNTIGFMYVYGTSSLVTCIPVSGPSLPLYSMALVVLLYAHFLAPLVITIALRLAIWAGCNPCAGRALRVLAEWGILAGVATGGGGGGGGQGLSPPPHAAAHQIRRVPSEKYRAGMFGAGGPRCVICMSDYEPGQRVRVLPCGGAAEASEYAAGAGGTTSSTAASSTATVGGSSGCGATASVSSASHGKGILGHIFGGGGGAVTAGKAHDSAPAGASSAAPDGGSSGGWDGGGGVGPAAPSPGSSPALHPHHFHKECIDTWLRVHASCPICRTSMLDPEVIAAAQAAIAAQQAVISAQRATQRAYDVRGRAGEQPQQQQAQFDRSSRALVIQRGQQEAMRQWESLHLEREAEAYNPPGAPASLSDPSTASGTHSVATVTGVHPTPADYVTASAHPVSPDPSAAASAPIVVVVPVVLSTGSPSLPIPPLDAVTIPAPSLRGAPTPFDV